MRRDTMPAVELFPVLYFRCHRDEFRCALTKVCIPRAWVMDNVLDCNNSFVSY